MSLFLLRTSALLFPFLVLFFAKVIEGTGASRYCGGI
jgi:hypothetical protein